MRKFIKYNRQSTRNAVTQSKNIQWTSAPDVKKRVLTLLDSLQVGWAKKSRIVCFRSKKAKTRAYARIWGLARIWQMALKTSPAYIIEVISERFDKLSDAEKDKVLLHELSHIPKNFSGALLPHIKRGKRSFYRRVEGLINEYYRLTR